MSDRDSRSDGAKENNRILQALAQVTQFGINMMVPIFGMSLLGYFLDQRFETSWIFILCFFIGAVAGFQNIYRVAMRMIKDRERPVEKKLGRPEQEPWAEDGAGATEQGSALEGSEVSREVDGPAESSTEEKK